MDSWNSERRPVKAGYPPEDVQKYCVRDELWQSIRRSMKGKDTQEKLNICAAYYDRHTMDGKVDYRVECQVGNYLGALRRGGQLNMDNEVQR